MLGNFKHPDQLKVKIFADGADLEGIRKLKANSLIKGFTTNPTLMKSAGVKNYKQFAQEVLRIVTSDSVSFEVFADDFDEMEAQALEIASWGRNVYVKIPVTDTKGNSSGPLIERLSSRGIALNVTALLTLDQVRAVTQSLAPSARAIISVFGGRIADTGVDPMPIMCSAVEIIRTRPRAELLWASPREVLNVYQADEVGCHIITVSHDLLPKLSLFGRDLNEYSLATVKMFYNDAQAAGFSIATTKVGVE